VGWIRITCATCGPCRDGQSGHFADELVSINPWDGDADVPLKALGQRAIDAGPRQGGSELGQQVVSQFSDSLGFRFAFASDNSSGCPEPDYAGYVGGSGPHAELLPAA